MANGIIHLPGTSDEQSFEGTKNSCDHRIPLSTYPLEMLRRLYEERTSETYVFPQKNNPEKPVTKDHQVFAEVSELFGSLYSPHASRRTFASVTQDAGIKYLIIKSSTMP